MVDLDDDVSSVHQHCPFCDGEYVIAGAILRHSLPSCDTFKKADGAEFIRRARALERRNDATATKG